MTGKVLYVDDCPIAREVVRRTLIGSGFDVSTLDNLFELQTALDDDRPDILLLDVNMPFLDGIRAHEILQRHGMLGELPVIFFSDLEESELAETARQAGVAGYVTKASGGGALVSALRAQLQMRKLDDSGTWGEAPTAWKMCMPVVESA